MTPKQQICAVFGTHARLVRQIYPADCGKLNYVVTLYVTNIIGVGKTSRQAWTDAGKWFGEWQGKQLLRKLEK